MPLAAHAILSGNELTLRAAWGDPEGETTLVTAQTKGQVKDLEQAEALGLQIADELRKGGAH
jgi:hydroxymethylbilane synthase